MNSAMRPRTVEQTPRIRACRWMPVSTQPAEQPSSMTKNYDAIIERNSFGGTCVNIACVPAKTMVASGKRAFTRTALNDAEIVGADLLDNDPRKVSDRITAYALCIDPPLRRAGLTEAEVRKSSRRALIGRPMTEIGGAVEKEFMKIIVDAQTRQILGAAILGTGGDKAIHSILDVMYDRAPYPVIQRAMHIHPTVSKPLSAAAGARR
jgi:pyruvate/2-oxoglutarate dehydrogenase complex dihydrolipoamide dehydrogenase (E3) component